MTAKRSPVEVRCHRAASWIKKAEGLPDSDLDGHFIFLWIAFNALYGQPKFLEKKKGPEERDFKRFLNLVCSIDKNSRIGNEWNNLRIAIHDLITDIYLNDDLWIAWHERVLETVTERGKYSFLDRNRKASMEELFGRTYVLRKQLFHGCSSDKGSKNRESLRRAVQVLEKLVPPIH